MELEIILAVIGLFLSGYFSGSEIAFISANPLQMQIWASQDVFGAKTSQTYLDNREDIFFQASRKTGFILQQISDKLDPHIGWGFIVALHQRVYA